MIKATDDGKVSIERTKLQGMTDHIVIKTAHPFIMNNVNVYKQTLAFLRNGSFDAAAKLASD